jgi:ABC-type Fe3+ transport system permease subunit
MLFYALTISMRTALGGILIAAALAFLMSRAKQALKKAAERPPKVRHR